MSFYPTLMTLHIIFAGIWLINLVTDSVLKNKVKTELKNNSGIQMISLYLQFGNLLGMIGAIGILVSGIVLVSMNPGYGFFDMTSNHWLATKQIITVIILIMIFAVIIPTSKKVRNDIENNLNSGENKNLEENLKKLFKINASINGLVVLNFLFAITHRFIG